jgi:thioredoxin reductase (NADPH)
LFIQVCKWVGQLTTTTEVDNYPGYQKGTDGTAMMDDFKNQAERFGTVEFGLATKVEFIQKLGNSPVTIDESKIIKAERSSFLWSDSENI